MSINLICKSMRYIDSNIRYITYPTTTGGFDCVLFFTPFSFLEVTFKPGTLSLSSVFNGYPSTLAVRLPTCNQFRNHDLKAEIGGGGPPTKSSTLSPVLFAIIDLYHDGARRSNIRHRRYRPISVAAIAMRHIAHGGRSAVMIINLCSS